MKLEVKLPEATYTISIDGQSMTLDCTKMGVGLKDKQEKLITSTLGFFGPFQLENAFNRIITEELSLNNDVIPLREFLRRYKVLHDNIIEQVTELKQEFKKQL